MSHSSARNRRALISATGRLGDLLTAFFSNTRAARCGQQWRMSEFVSTAFITFSAFLALIRDTNDVFASIFGFSLDLVKFPALCFAIALGYLAVTKTETVLADTTTLSDRSQPREFYIFSHGVRWVCRLAVLALLPFVPSTFVDLGYAVSFLPSTFYGYVYDGQKRLPIEGARIEVILPDGSNVTDGYWVSDSSGFYVVRTRIRVRRNASLVIFRDACEPERLSLHQKHEGSEEMLPTEQGIGLSPVYLHTSGCVPIK